jgi:alpha-mannosidase
MDIEAQHPATGAYPLHLIANAHMDPVWIWDWREGFGEVWATFRSALDRIREHPELIFTASSASHHAWIAEHDPAMFAEIKAAVAAGRWFLAGGMWVEPDCNLPSGEAFCRQLLAGQRFFQREFGRTATVGYNVDSFGHNAGLPQLLRSAGLTSYVFMRPGDGERELPGQLFRWRDASGAEVLAYRIPFAYETHAPKDIARRVEQGAERAAAQHIPLMLFVGVGNHGGGPTKATLAELDLLQPKVPGLHYGDPGSYFGLVTAEGLAADAPVVTGELQHHAVGCYSASAWVKAGHDAAEAALLDAEAAEAVAARLARRPGRQVELSAAWTELLLFEFHDVLAGSASARAYDSMRARLGHVHTVADTITTNALYQIAHRIDTMAGLPAPVERHLSFWTGREGVGVPFLIYNPLPWTARQPVIASRSAGQVLDSSGRQVPYQAVASGEVTLFPSHTLFVANLPPLGYEVFWLYGGSRQPPDGPASPDAAGIESDRMRAEIDPGTGAIVSIYDRQARRELVGEGGIRLVLQRDGSDTWSHHLARYDGTEMTGRFLGHEVTEDGPLRWTLRLRFAFSDSLVTTVVSLLAGEPYAQVRLRADWREPQVVLKLLMSWQLGSQTRTVAGAAYGIAERAPTGDEEPVHGWLDCHDPQADLGVTIITGHLHGYDATGAQVRLTVLRNPLAADHGAGWGTATRPEDFPLADSGTHDATIRVLGHTGNWQSARAVARAAEQARPPLVVADTYHPGELAPAGAFLTVEPGGLPVVRAVKRAESADAVVLRLVEPDGQPCTVQLGGSLLGRDITAELAPHELQTLLIPDDLAMPVRRVDVTELSSQ